MEDFIVLVPLALFALFALSLMLTDFREHRLPNRMTLSLIAVTFACLFLHLASTGKVQPYVNSIVAGLMTFGLGYLLVKYFDLGMGDVKLLTSLNALLAWHSPWLILYALAIGFAGASVWAILVWIKTRNPRARIALGPYLIVGFAAVIAQPTTELITAVV